ncbi:unnamed protein product [Mytilus coruscus]|uniref:DUF6589 domain-containing protein n=1 Tax=Mytilus coruscus TaxID=42192 RepID=A0A6J8EHR7_MYTCO|nr:unnamed protein product [Mytilus coruscus]
MEWESSVCLHCSHVFDKNLKNERRRKVSNISDVDFIDIIAKTYSLDFDLLKKFLDTNEDVYICAKCYNSVKSVSTNSKKYDQSKTSLTDSASNDFKNLSIQIEYRSIPSNSGSALKRNRSSLTPTKSGCTPRAKKQDNHKNVSNSSTKTPKNNRRRLCFSDKKSTQSPGPKVKVNIGYHGSSRNTILKGHEKLACRALVMKQYRTAVNHMFALNVKKEIGIVIKKKINKEITEVIKNKDTLLRSTNLSSFSWKSAYKQLENKCPLTMDLLQTICGEKKKNEPRLVTSMAVLLFTRNQQINTIQSINSVLMFRGHVRTKVYTTFNRAGLISSYKSTLNTIDKLCEKFDEPVKRWTEQLSSETIDQNTSLGDHTYAATSDECSVENIAADDNILHIQCPPVMYIAEPITDTCTASDFSSVDTCKETVPTTDSPMENLYDFVDNGTSVPPRTPLCSIENHTTYYTPMQPSVPCEEDSPFTTKSSAAIQETGSFQIIMDNLNMNQKTRHKTADTSNKVHNLVHSIAVNDRATPTDPLDEIHPQADILSLSNDLFIPSDNDIHQLNEDFKILIQRALVDNIPGLSEYRQVVQYHILHEFSQQAEKKSTVIPLGILEKDENITEQMIDVITHLQQYVPKRDKKLKPLLLGGDALSVERGESAQKARIDAVTCEDRLDGFIWKSEDWHGHVISIQDTFNLHFKGSSSGVKSEVKDAVNDCREFLRFVTRGYIILGAMHLLGFDSLEKFKDLNHTSDTQKKEFLEKLSQNIVDQYITTEKFDLDTLKETNTREEGRHPCGYPGCKKSFAVDGKCRSKHRFRCPYKDFDGVLQPGNDTDQHVQSTIEVEKKKEDFKHNYSCSLLRDGLFDWCREDAAREK